MENLLVFKSDIFCLPLYLCLTGFTRIGVLYQFSRDRANLVWSTESCFASFSAKAEVAKEHSLIAYGIL